MHLKSLRSFSLLLIGLTLSVQAEAQNFPKPKAEHRLMADEVGVWDAKVQLWPAPGAPMMESTGKETCVMLGGFWLLSTYEGEVGGKAFTGIAHTGYDTVTGKYVSTWIDSLSPYMLSSTGEYDAASATLTLTGESHDWMTNQAKRFRMTTTYLDPNHKRFEIQEAPEGSEDWRKSMVIDYTRQQ